jgi:hypothetical protein
LYKEGDTFIGRAVGKTTVVMVLKNERREQAAQLLAEDRHNDKKIAELCRVSLACITKWKKCPEIEARIAELKQIYADKAPARKVYQPPKFTKYGSLTEMTRAILLGMGNRDNITGLTKTS